LTVVVEYIVVQNHVAWLFIYNVQVFEHYIIKIRYLIHVSMTRLAHGISAKLFSNTLQYRIVKNAKN